MAANFPNSPSTNDTFTENGLTFVWNGSAWKLNSSSGTKGEKGQKGEVGVTGSKGQKGEKGEVGDRGQKGEIGATGGTGGTGQKGQKGEQGATGSAGSDGSDGDKGQKGELGSTGAGGSTGAKGQKGEVGATGGTGGTGSTGDKGQKGQKGEIGATGAGGSTGSTGAKGQKGEVGATGATGGTGGTGSTGAKGQKGEASTVAGDKGQKGEIGTTGDKGATGAGDKGQKGEEGPQGGGAPVGQIVAWSGSASSLPTGYFLCDGSAVSRTTYAALFTVVGTTHGAGNGSSTFNIPDLRDRFVVGASSSGGYSVGNTGGSKDAVLVSHTHNLQNHVHGINLTTNDPGGHTHGIPRGQGGSQASMGPYVPNPSVEYAQSPFNTTSGGAHTHTVSGNTGASVPNTTDTLGESATNKNLPPYYALAYIIQFSQGGETAKGQKGETGSTGSTGSTGAKGQKGEEGDKGAASSVQGPTGDKGQKGEVGATGAGGSTGSTGAKGQKGELGSTGSTGSTGSAGSDGSDGDKGQKGEVGAQGSTGASGPATIPQIKKAENTAQFYTSNSNTHTRVTLALTGVDNNSHVLIMWRAEIFSGSGTGANCQTYLDGGSFTGGSTSGTHNVQNWAGFGDITIDRGSGTSRTYNIKFKKNSGAQAYFRNGYLFAMEMKPN